MSVKWLVPALFVVFVAPLPVHAADLDDCAEPASECKEDCLIQYGGSIRVEMKRKFEKCVKKCSKKANLCRERVIETKNNALEDGALDKSPGSDEVDEHNMPTRTTATRGKKDDAERQTTDDLRDDRPAPEPKPEKSEKGEPKKSAPPKEELRANEVPRSTRTQLKTDPRDEPKLKEEPPPKSEPTAREEPKPREETKPRSEPPPGKKREEDSVVRNEVKPPKKAEEPVKTEPRADSRRPLDEDLRDDRGGSAPAASTRRDEPPPPPPKKREEKKDLPPPKKEEDHDDLRNY